MHSGFIGELTWRGLLHQTTSEAVGHHLSTPGRVGYVGFDPTSDSLTIGNLLPLTILARWQRAGHRPIVVMGGATGCIGDPSGKSNERQLLSLDQVRHNIHCQRPIFERLLEFTGRHAASMVDNADWLMRLGYIELLRDVGKHFSVNQMVARDSVATRLSGREQGISYTEFSYMILQAYDFLHLHRTAGCTVQIGGADQWGNICSGIDLIRRIDGGDAFGITNQLVTKSDGTKIGKSESGAIYLNANRTSPYKFHQYWLNAADDDAVRFLKWFTFFDAARIEEIADSHLANPSARHAQHSLADELTTVVHGADETRRANECANALFAGDIRSLDERSAHDIAADMQGAVVESAALEQPGKPVIDLLVEVSLASSKREARGFLESGAVQVNGVAAKLDDRVVREGLLHGRYAFIRRGKRSWAVARVAH